MLIVTYLSDKDYKSIKNGTASKDTMRNIIVNGIELPKVKGKLVVMSDDVLSENYDFDGMHQWWNDKDIRKAIVATI